MIYKNNIYNSGDIGSIKGRTLKGIFISDDRFWFYNDSEFNGDRSPDRLDMLLLHLVFIMMK
jgi:hypothetical protein